MYHPTHGALHVKLEEDDGEMSLIEDMKKKESLEGVLC